MGKDAPRDTYAQRIRDLGPGETLTFSDPVAPDTTLAEAVDGSAEIKRRGYWRFNKTVRRLHDQTGHGFRLATQLVWDDRLGLALITTITRTDAGE